MTDRSTRKRECERFEVFGATLRYKKEKALLASEKYSEDHLPILDLSLGGLRFLSQSQLKAGTKVSLKVFDPHWEEILTLRGVVMWSALHPGQSYSFQIGVQFNPYGQKRGYNSPECLDKLLVLESRYGHE